MKTDNNKNILNLKNGQEFPNANLFWETMTNKTYLESTDENVKLSDDWIMIWKPDCVNKFGGKWMWSNKLQKIRSTTMAEHYGNGIVD